MSTLVGLLDCNNFFVSCERLFRPDLARRPVLVLSANDGCVVARSQEVKDIGVPMGVPYFKIKDIVKDKEIAVFSGNLTLYRDVSRRVFAIVHEELPVVQQYSIDEAFFEIKGTADLVPRLRSLRDTINQRVGIPVSVGVAESKTLAKVAAGIAKKETGTFVLQNAQWQTLAAEMQLGEIWGVGRRLSERYRRAGVHTAADIMNADRACIATQFGVPGIRVQAELLGTRVHDITQERPLQKSLMSSRSFSVKTSEINVLFDAVAYHTRHIAAELRAMNAGASTVRVSLRTDGYGDFFLRGGSDVAVLSAPSNDTFTLLCEAQKLAQSLYEPGVPYKKVGVTVSDITPVSGAAVSLFDDDEDNHKDLLDIVDQLNSKQNGEVVLLGTRLQSSAWKPTAVARSGAYTTQWADIATVSTK